jgi:acetyl-CoA acetyltransferase
MLEPNGKSFVDHLNVYDCSKVSDGASAIAVVSEEGLKKIGIPLSRAVEVVGWGQVADDITRPPEEPTELRTMKKSVEKALDSAGVSRDQIATAEIHDCFTIAGVMAVEAMGYAELGKGADFILEGNTSRTGKIPINTTGGLIGWGHPTGATGVHQAVTIWEQLTGQAGDAQINIPKEKPYGLSVNMGGNDKTLVSIVYKQMDGAV